MQRKIARFSRVVMLTVLGMLSVTPALAGKPAHAGGGNKHAEREHHSESKHREREDDHKRENNDRGDRHFDERHRAVVHEYYVKELRLGHCPPGLAKKNNGCRPPGQAKKWRKGRPLPREVVFYDLPPQLVQQLGAPPSGHRFVRVASDILLIVIGSGIVADAIDDLSRI